MTPPGHLAMAYIATRQRTRLGRRAHVAAFAMFGALLPDIIDKSLIVLGVYPWGRTVGHSLITWTLVAAFVVMIGAALRPLPRAPWVLVGVASHFFADLLDDAFAGVVSTSYALTSWFGWPLFTPDWREWRVSPIGSGPEMIPTWLEIAFIGFALLLMFLDARRMEKDDGNVVQHAVSGGDDQP